MRRLVVVALVVAGARAAEAQYCPSYTLSAPENNNNCGVEAKQGRNPTVAEWNDIFLLVSGGPARWGTRGPAVADINEGCGKPMPSTPRPATFPCELLKAIAMAETGWKQFCVPTAPSSQVGGAERTIISFDCGYGIGQVTSGMHRGEMPAFDRDRVAGDATYNLATGTQILAAKWRATSCVGDNIPAIIEDWYIATWAYNGLAASNDPNHANYDAMRPVCNPNVGCGARPYQEKVWGWMEYPRSAAHATSVKVAYPDRATITFSTTTSPRVPAIPEPSCAGPTDCTQRRPVHRSACLDGAAVDLGAEPPLPVEDGGAAAEADGGVGSGNVAGGCGCAVGGRAPVAGWGALVVVVVVAGWLRRRRRAASGRRTSS
jgi:MYXO-CTERM domain-containing protein